MRERPVRGILKELAVRPELLLVSAHAIEAKVWEIGIAFFLGGARAARRTRCAGGVVDLTAVEVPLEAEVVQLQGVEDCQWWES